MKPFNESEIILGNFVTHYKGDNYVIRATKYQLFSKQIKLTLHYEYTPEAEYNEHFDMQLNLRNDLEVKKWFSQIRPREEEEI